MNAGTDAGRIERLALLPHQDAALRYFLQNPRAVDLSQTGTGKTAAALRAAEHVLLAGERVLVVAERPTAEQWAKEARRFLDPECPSLLDWTNRGHGKAFIFITPQMLNTRLAEVRRSGALGLVIFDEAHSVSPGGENQRSAVYSAASEVVGAAAASILMTATPTETLHGLDLLALEEVAQLAATPSRLEVAPEVSYIEFANPGGHGSRRVAERITPYGEQLLLRPLLQGAIRTTIEQSGQQVPEVVRHNVAVPIVGGDAELYTAGAKVGELAGFQMKQRASRSPRSLVPVAVEQVLAALDAGYVHPVVFSDNFDVVTPLTEALIAKGLPVYEFSGQQTSRKARSGAVEAHKADPKAVLVGTKALETGLNLQHSSVLISVVETWNPSREEQREGRLVRVSSPHPRVLHIVIKLDVPLEYEKELRRQARADFANRILTHVPSPLALTAGGLVP